MNFQEGRARSYVHYHELSQDEKAVYKHPRTHLKVSVQYSEGGMNYFSGSTNKRGYRISFTPVERSGTGMESCILMGDQRESGFYIMLEEVKRYNANRLRFHADRLDERAEAISEAVVRMDIGAVRSFVALEQAVIA